MAGFQPEFDRVGVALSFAALLILLYFGLTVNTFFQNLWVAYAFWLVGFLGTFTLGLAKRSATLNLQSMFAILTGTALIVLCFFGVSTAYAQLPQDTALAEKSVSFAIGVSEELFFGVFLLGILINWLGIHPILAILSTAASHAFYHVPQWGLNPFQIGFFFICFLIARSVYVFVFPKVGVLLAAHGVWNAVVT